MDLVSRLVVVPATIAVFHPSFAVELAGAVVLAAILALNWLKARRTTQPRTAPE
jgi:hypothetical protein